MNTKYEDVKYIVPRKEYWKSKYKIARLESDKGLYLSIGLFIGMVIGYISVKFLGG